MDRIPGGSGIEPMLSVLETHIYQVMMIKKRELKIFSFVLKKMTVKVNLVKFATNRFWFVFF